MAEERGEDTPGAAPGCLRGAGVPRDRLQDPGALVLLPGATRGAGQ